MYCEVCVCACVCVGVSMLVFCSDRSFYVFAAASQHQIIIKKKTAMTSALSTLSPCEYAGFCLYVRVCM